MYFSHSKSPFRSESCEDACDACKAINLPGRVASLCGCIQLKAATDDFVVYGCKTLFIRTVQLVLLGIAWFVFYFRQDNIVISSDIGNATYSGEACTWNSTISATLLAFIFVNHTIILIIYIMYRKISIPHIFKGLGNS